MFFRETMRAALVLNQYGYTHERLYRYIPFDRVRELVNEANAIATEIEEVRSAG